MEVWEGLITAPATGAGAFQPPVQKLTAAGRSFSDPKKLKRKGRKERKGRSESDEGGVLTFFEFKWQWTSDDDRPLPKAAPVSNFAIFASFAFQLLRNPER